jgi:hypothetical protein
MAILVAKWAGLAAAGVARTRYAKVEIPNPFARRPTLGGAVSGPAPTDTAGIVAPKKPVAGSPEHKAARWSEYQARGGEWSYERWSKTYDRNIVRASQANAAVDDFWQQLGWGRRVGDSVALQGHGIRAAVEGTERRRHSLHRWGITNA